MEDYIGIIHTEKDNIILEEKLGEGLTSLVYLCRFTKSPKDKHAIKIFNDNSYYFNEVNVLTRLNHPNIIQMIDYGEGTIERGCNSESFELSSAFRHLDKINYIIFEYLPNGELFNYIAKIKEGFSEDMARQIFKSLIEAISYCINKANICHCDIKLENVLLTEDFRPKLIDFGFGRNISSSRMLYEWNGTHGYSSPQVYNANKGYNGVANEIFSLGVLLFILCVGKMPFDTSKPNDWSFKLILRGEFASFWRRFENKKQTLSAEFKDLIQKMLCAEERNRITIEQLLGHKWLAMTDDSYLDKINKEIEASNSLDLNMNEFYHKEFTFRKFIIDTNKSANKRS